MSFRMNYTPPATVARFMEDRSLVRCTVGPLGSGKSMGCIMEMFRRACAQAPHDGVRRTRFAIVRNTLAQIKSTVLVDVLQYLGPLASHHVTDSTIKVRAHLSDGTRVESDWLLMPLDRPEDQQRLLSLQLTGAWINECREVPFDVVSALIGRCGRFPSKALGGCTWYGVLMDSNCWSVASPYHEAFVLDPVKNWRLFRQPSGLSPLAENTENLPAGYYDNLANGRDEEWVRVHVHAEWGDDLSGQAVFRRSFNPQLHVIDTVPQLNPMRPIIVGQDFGRTPAALIGQVDVYGRLLIMEEVTTEDMGLVQMLQERLKPVLLQEPYFGKRVFMVADPAGGAKSQLREETAFDIIEQNGLQVFPAPTNDIAPRLMAVEKLLRSGAADTRALLISRAGCPKLIRALGAEYRYRRKRGAGELEDLPEKRHPWSDLADCLQYMALAVNTDLHGKVLRRDVRAGTPRPRINAAAWT